MADLDQPKEGQSLTTDPAALHREIRQARLRAEAVLEQQQEAMGQITRRANRLPKRWTPPGGNICPPNTPATASQRSRNSIPKSASKPEPNLATKSESLEVSPIMIRLDNFMAEGRKRLVDYFKAPTHQIPEHPIRDLKQMLCLFERSSARDMAESYLSAAEDIYKDMREFKGRLRSAELAILEDGVDFDAMMRDLEREKRAHVTRDHQAGSRGDKNRSRPDSQDAPPWKGKVKPKVKSSIFRVVRRNLEERRSQSAWG